MTDALITKLGAAKGQPRSRIWLQGSRLPEHGFKLGARFHKSWSNGKLVLTAVNATQAFKLPGNEIGKVCGDAARPVIDIVGKRVAETFKGTHVKARFATAQIVITEV